MKKTLSLFGALLIAVMMNAQSIDTVLVRNLQLQAQDWAWIIGNVPDIVADSATAYHYRRIRDRIRTANPAAWTTNVTVDSIPGKIALWMYVTTKTSHAGEIATRYSAITSSLEGKANLTSFINAFNTRFSSEFDLKRNRGKSIVMDN
jgi:hypothetical protein